MATDLVHIYKAYLQVLRVVDLANRFRWLSSQRFSALFVAQLTVFWAFKMQFVEVRRPPKNALENGP